MAKKKHVEEHENLERWLVSYADFITLLFATFVVLYALSQLDLVKFKDLQISLRKAFSPESIIQGDTSILNSQGQSILSSGADPEASMISPIFENMEAKYEESSFSEVKNSLDSMQSLSDIQGVQSNISERGLTITFIDSLIFSSGSAVLRPGAIPTLRKVAGILREKFPDHPIRVEGHTDNLSIKSGVFPSNWELSAARASTVVRFMISNFDFAKNRFAAIGYADSKPVAPNKTEKDRAKNRRVEIVILRNKLLKAEPFIPGLNKARVDRVKEIEKEQQSTLKQYDSVSEAARKLMQDSGQTNQAVLRLDDSYQKESEKISKQIKSKEKSISSQEKPQQPSTPKAQDKTPLNKTESSNTQSNKAQSKDASPNDAVSNLVKEHKDKDNMLILREKK